LSGRLNPENTPTTYYFEYGTSPCLPETCGTVVTEPSQVPLYGDEVIPVSVRLCSLAPNTTYHYALVAYNEEGRTTGPEETFTTAAATPPLAMTGEASDVTQTTATITGTVDTKGLQSTYGFEVATEPGNYGPTTGLGTFSSTTTETVSLTLEDLQPGTTYYYRLCARNQDGSSCGAEGTFTTAGAPNPLVAPVTLPLLAVPPGAFAVESVPPKPTSRPTQPTNAQKLEKALKQCKKDKKSKRAACEKRARKKYGPKEKKRRRA
jgi:hypothetical protein